MGRPLHRQRLPWQYRSFLLLAAVCASMMPTFYKGGAEVAHAHGFFEFWISGPEHAFHHHHGEHGFVDLDHETAHADAARLPAVNIELAGDDADQEGVRVLPPELEMGSMFNLAVASHASLDTLESSLIGRILFSEQTRPTEAQRSPEVPPPRTRAGFRRSG